jgi:hypothetical protein
LEQVRDLHGGAWLSETLTERVRAMRAPACDPGATPGGELTPPLWLDAAGRRGSHANLAGMIVSVLAALLGVGCATPVPRYGTSGSVSWEISEDTVTLRETAGIGIRFTSLKYVIPLPPAGYYRSSGEQPVRGRLEPHGVLRISIPRAAPGGVAEYEFHGVDDNGRPININVRVELREVP